MAEGKFPSAAEYMREWSQTLIDQLKESAVKEMERNKGDSGSLGIIAASPLVQGIRFTPTFLGEKITFAILMPASWYWLEHGRPPGKMPPEEPIMKWITHRGFSIDPISGKREKLIRSLKTKRLRKVLKQYSKEKQRKQLAFLIRRKIGKEGTRETKFYSNIVTDNLLDDLKTTMRQKFKKDIIVELQTLATS